MNKGYFYITITNFFFAITYLGTKFMFKKYPDLDVYNLSFWGLLSASCLFSPIVLLRPHYRQQLVGTIQNNGLTIVAISMISSVAAFLWFMALEQADTGPVALLIKTTVIFSILWGVLFLKESMSWLQYIGIGIAALGLFFISTLNNEISLTAVLLSLASAFFFSSQSFLVKKYGIEIDGKSFAILRAILMALIFGIGFTVFGQIRLISLPQFFMLGFISGVGLIIGRTFFFQAHMYLDISKLSTVILLEPIIIMIGAYFLFAEGFSSQKVIGSLLILLGLYGVVAKDIKSP